MQATVSGFRLPRAGRRGTVGALILAAAGASSAQEIESPVSVDTFFGAASFSYRIEVPPGTGGMQPELELTYSSSLGESGLGQGWKLSGLDCVELSTKLGVPGYVGQDPLTLSGEEVVDTVNSFFHTKIESFLRMEQFLQGLGNSYWVVTQRDGRKLRLGFDSMAEVPQGVPAVQTFRWHVDQVSDPHGNSLNVTYDDLGDPGVLYPTGIEYTLHGGQLVGPAREVSFAWEVRPDPQVDFSAGFEQRRQHRLASISTTVGGSLVKRYDISYTPDPNTGRSLLTSIQEVGSDGATLGPEARFDYGSANNAFDAPVSWFGIEGQQGGGLEWRHTQWLHVGAVGGRQELFDMDGDGFTDRVRQGYENPITDWAVQLGNGAGFDPYVGWPDVWSPHTDDRDWCATWSTNDGHGKVAILDLDGDGLLDRLLRDESDYDVWTAQFNHGTGFEDPLGWPGVEDPSAGGAQSGWKNLRWNVSGADYVQLVDMNGDHLPDRLLCGPADVEAWWIQLGTGAGFLPAEPWTGVVSPEDDSDWSRLSATGNGQRYNSLIDMNGDGLPDRVLRGYGGGSELSWTVQFNRGDSFASPVAWPGVATPQDHPAWNSPGFNEGWVTQVALRDMNGDGLPDRVWSYGGNDPASLQWGVQFNSGFGFRPPITWAGVWSPYPADSYWNAFETQASNGATTDVLLVDVNGDGLLDRVVKEDGFAEDEWRVQINASISTWLLRQVELPTKGLVDLEYTPATWFDNTTPGGQSGLGSPFPVVTRMTVSDGIGGEESMAYDYAGGLYDPETREFRGFAKTVVTDPADSITELCFLQEGELKGRQLSSERRDSTGALYSTRVNEWSSMETFPGLGVFVVTLDGQTTTVFDGNGSSVTERVEYSYDAYGNVTERRLLGDTTDPDDDLTHVTDYIVNPSSVWIVGTPRYAEVRDADDVVVTTTEFFYDGSTDSTAPPPTAGLLTRQVEGLGGLKAEVDMTYDAHGNLLTTEDELGRVTALTYDGSSTFPVTIAYPLGQSESFTHDPGTGRVLTSTDRNGLTTTNMYDALGRLMRSYGPEDPMGVPDLPGVELAYDTTSTPCRVETRVRRVSGSTDPADMLTSYAFYDGFGRKVQLRQPDGDPATQIVEDTVYDGGGRVLRQSHPYREAASTSFPPGGLDATRSSEHYEYDLMGRKVLVTHPDLSTVATSYDDRRVARTDENGELVEFVYDSHGRLASVEEHLSSSETLVTSYEYDALGNLTRLTNAKGDVTQITYDALSRKVATDDMDLGSWTYEYDLADNLVARTDARGVRVEYAYDELNRMVSKTFPSDPPVQYIYDAYPTGVTPGPHAIGQRTFVEDGSGSTAFYYDTDGNVSAEERTITGEGVFRVERGFDALGNLTEIVYPDAERVIFDFDPAGRVRGAHGPSAQPIYLADVQYDPSGQKTFVEFGNGIQTSYAYDPLTRRLLELSTEDAQTALQSFQYAYDAHGNVLSITDSMPPGPEPNLTQSFEYDALHRLTLADGHYSDAPGIDGIEYEYDAVGNMTRRGDRSFRFGPPNGPANGMSKGTHGFRAFHDPNGNMAAIPGRLFQYDEDNRLRAVQVLPGFGGTPAFPDDPIPPDSIAQSLTVEFLYDGDGGRVRKTDSLGGKTLYVGGAYEVRDGRPIKHVYLGSERVASIETPSPANPDPDDLYYHPDHLGSASLITSQDGEVVDFIAYLPFGSDAVQAGGHTTPYLFTGKERDPETGLYFMEARYFAPFLCRFASPDEVARDLGDPQSLNRYAYSRNNPLRYSDPSGNFFLELLVGYFLAQNETVQQFVQQTERNFIRPLTHNPSQYLRDHRAQLRDAAVAAGVAVVGSLLTGVSGGGALPVLVGALKYATTSLILSTPGGQEGISRLANGLQQVGVSPRVSYIAAGAMGSVALNGTADQLLEGFGLDAMRSVNRFDVDLVKEQPLAQLGLKQVELSQSSLSLNAIKGFSARSIIDETLSLTGVLSAQDASVETGALDLLSAAPDSLLSRHLGSVLVQLELSWGGAAHAAIHGTLGYRLGRETSEAFRNDVPLRRQLLQQETTD